MNLTCEDLQFTPLLKSITIDQISLNSCLASPFSSPLKATATDFIPFIFFVHALLDLAIYFGWCYFQFRKHFLQTHPFPSTCITVLKIKKIKKPSDHRSTFILVASTKWLSNLSCVVLRTPRNKLIYKKNPRKTSQCYKEVLKTYISFHWWELLRAVAAAL